MYSKYREKSIENPIAPTRIGIVADCRIDRLMFLIEELWICVEPNALF